MNKSKSVRNLPCPCGSELKFKKCHLFLKQGWVKSATGWISPDEVQKRRMQTQLTGEEQDG